MKELIINFGGFYNSVHEYIIDNAIERERESLIDELGVEDCKLNYLHDLNYQPIFNYYCKELVAELNHDTLDNNITINFQALESPKFYNYDTDKIISLISSESYTHLILNTLFNDFYQDELSEAIKAKFSSRSGFISFYSNDLAEWQEKEELDCNELGFLYNFLINEVLELDAFNAPHEYNYFSETIDNFVLDELYTQKPELNDLWSA